MASSFGSNFHEGDEVILTVMEHHANIVPWQLLQKRTGIKLRVVDINERGELRLDQYRSYFNDHTMMVAFCHVSNVLGTINPVKEMIDYAHEHDVAVLIDGAQAAPHLHIDVQDLDADFMPSQAIRCTDPPALACSMDAANCLKSCPLIREAAR